jgi:hypothetical protein
LAKAGISLAISQYTDKAGLIHFDTEQKTLGRTVEQTASLDGKAVEADHPLFGKISVSHRWAPVSTMKQDYLKEALEDGTTDVVELLIENSEDGWSSRQVLAIENVKGERRHTRRTVVTNGDEVAKTRIVYDWEGN